jgi:protein TonB
MGPLESKSDQAVEPGLVRFAEPLRARLVLQPDATSASRGPFVSALIAAGLLHLALATALVWQPADRVAGSSGVELDAVSVEIVTAAALESTAVSPTSASSGSAQPIAEQTGTEVVAPQAQSVAAPEKTEATPEPPKVAPVAADIVAPPDAALEAVLTAAEKPVDRAAKPDPTPVEQEPPPDAPKVEPREHREPEPVPAAAAADARPAVMDGGSTARGATSESEASGAAGAPPGAMQRYAMEVRLALGRSRPRHAGVRGRVTITFALDDAGQVRAAEIARSSGIATADKAALQAVQSAKFPKPPHGSSDSQRTYTVPFDFR